MARFDLRRRLTAEFLGTGTLVCAVVGSGIMGERLAGGNTALALLGNTLPTGAILTVLILILGPISGAHMNPAVSLAMARRRELPAGEAVAYAVAQMAGGIAGASTAHLMFDLPMIQLGSTVRTGLGQWIGEFVATFGLLATILGCLRFARAAIAPAVGLYITAAYWFTSSTSFANPAVTLARALSDTFAGIRPIDLPGFWVAQLAGAMAAVAVFGWIHEPRGQEPSPGSGAAAGRGAAEREPAERVLDRTS
jgi:glycerol uptake facilitator-like aquaporin